MKITNHKPQPQFKKRVYIRTTKNQPNEVPLVDIDRLAFINKDKDLEKQLTLVLNTINYLSECINEKTELDMDFLLELSIDIQRLYTLARLALKKH